jgi:plasmid stabilization system protein ParE
MAYKITFRERASREFLNSLFWYKERSLIAAENFVGAIDDTLERISVGPTSFRNTYKEFYEASAKKFPFSIVYFIDHTNKRVVIVSIFHFRRSPKKKFP